MLFKLYVVLVHIYYVCLSCQRTASDANYRMIRTLFIAMTILCLENSALA